MYDDLKVEMTLSVATFPRKPALFAHGRQAAVLHTLM
jgi:hypothetical protein